MGAFGIFAIVLTGIYIVYYAVMIIFDIYGKKAKAGAGSEDIAVGDILNDEEEEEEFTRVVEHEDGTFDVIRPGSGDDEDDNHDGDGSDGDYDGGMEGDDIPDSDIPSEVEGADTTGSFDNIDDEEDNDEEYEGHTVTDDFEEARRKAEAEMTPTSPRFAVGYDSATYRVVMGQPINQPTKILRKVVTVK